MKWSVMQGIEGVWSKAEGSIGGGFTLWQNVADL